MTNTAFNPDLSGFDGHSGVAPSEIELMLKVLPNDGVLVEVGTYHGVTVAYMAQQKPDAFFLSIDLFPDPKDPRSPRCIGSVEYWMKNRQHNAALFIGSVLEFSRFCVPDYADVVMVDGDHCYEHVIEDLRCAAKIVKPEGTILAHDYKRSHVPHPGVDRGVRTFVQETAWDIVNVVHYTAILRRSNGQLGNPDKE